MEDIKITKEFAFKEFEIARMAAIGYFGSGEKQVLFEGIQRIHIADNLEISAVSISNDICANLVNVTLIGSDDSVNSLMKVENLSTELIWDVAETIKQMILGN